MPLLLQHPQERLYIRSCRPDAITVIDRDVRQSFVLSPTLLIESWPVCSVADLNQETIAPILNLKPEVVLLGTGAKLTFPEMKILAEFLTQGIGIEAMDNAAASRTFNVLTNEQRNVVAAFILPIA